MERGLEMARAALARQAQQSVLAVGVAALGLLALAPLVALAKTEHPLLGEMPLFFAVSNLCLLTIETLVEVMILGRVRLGRTVRTVVVQVAMWALAIAIATQLGIEELSLGAVPVLVLVYMLSRPFAILLAYGIPCRTKLRRTARELKLSLVRVCGLGVGFSTMLYMYLTMFMQLTPIVEVIVMGLGMPLIQAAFMLLVAELTARQERVSKRVVRKRSAAVADDPSVEPEPKPGLESQLPPPAQAANAGESLATLIMVFGAEICYSTCAFAALALAESDGSFYVSLVSMLSIEVVQVVLHVKARHVVQKVVNENAADALLGNTLVIRQWLLHQELGEKIGLLLALGVLALDNTLETSTTVHVLDTSQTIRRALAMVLLELVGDLIKDVLSQMLGVIPLGPSSGRVSLAAIGVCFAIAECLIAGSLVQMTLALGNA